MDAAKGVVDAKSRAAYALLIRTRPLHVSKLTVILPMANRKIFSLLDAHAKQAREEMLQIITSHPCAGTPISCAMTQTS
jgi:hypothetical protein